MNEPNDNAFRMPMKTSHRIVAFAIAVLPIIAMAVETATESPANDFTRAAASIQQKLTDSTAELSALREQIVAEQVPLSRKLSDLENDLLDARVEFQSTTRLLDSRTLDISTLTSEIASRKQEAAYLSNLLGEYLRNMESRLHIAELQRYRQDIESAKLAAENRDWSEQDITIARTAMLDTALDRLFDALGGTRFDGTATDSTGSIHHGTFVLIGPSAIFQSDDGLNIGSAQQRLGSLEPTVIAYGTPTDADSAAAVIAHAAGDFPLDPTLGNAHKIEATHETLFEHIQKGGVVMIPIFVLAGAALLVALVKWLQLAFVPRASASRIRMLLTAVADHNRRGVRIAALSIKGPVGRMLTRAVDHIREPRDLIEEVMFEDVLARRIALERFLPFIAICAARPRCWACWARSRASSTRSSSSPCSVPAMSRPSRAAYPRP